MSRPDAVDAAARALARRDRSEAGLRLVLAGKGISEADADAALDVLRRGGVVDDERFARASADALARRGFGDAAIAHRLEREGVPPGLVDEAIAGLEPELERARPLVDRRGASARTARWLAGRGFDEETISSLAGRIAETDIAELG